MAYLPVIERSYLTEVQLTLAPGANQSVKFLDIPELSQRKHKVIIYSIECFNASDLATSPGSRTVVALLTGITVTFVQESTEDVLRYPCNDLRPGANSGLMRMFNKKRINIPSSYITIYNATGLNQNEVVLFNFIYAISNK